MLVLMPMLCLVRANGVCIEVGWSQSTHQMYMSITLVVTQTLLTYYRHGRLLSAQMDPCLPHLALVCTSVIYSFSEYMNEMNKETIAYVCVCVCSFQTVSHSLRVTPVNELKNEWMNKLADTHVNSRGARFSCCYAQCTSYVMPSFSALTLLVGSSGL